MDRGTVLLDQPLARHALHRAALDAAARMRVLRAAVGDRCAAVYPREIQAEDRTQVIRSQLLQFDLGRAGQQELKSAEVAGTGHARHELDALGVDLRAAKAWREEDRPSGCANRDRQVV